MKIDYKMEYTGVDWVSIQDFLKATQEAIHFLDVVMNLSSGTSRMEECYYLYKNTIYMLHAGIPKVNYREYAFSTTDDFFNRRKSLIERFEEEYEETVFY